MRMTKKLAFSCKHYAKAAPSSHYVLPRLRLEINNNPEMFVSTAQPIVASYRVARKADACMIKHFMENNFAYAGCAIKKDYPFEIVFV